MTNHSNIVRVFSLMQIQYSFVHDSMSGSVDRSAAGTTIKMIGNSGLPSHMQMRLKMLGTKALLKRSETLLGQTLCTVSYVNHIFCGLTCCMFSSYVRYRCHRS